MNDVLNTTVTNFQATLPPAQSDLAHEAMKDPYFFDFRSKGSLPTIEELEAEFTVVADE